MCTPSLLRAYRVTGGSASLPALAPRPLAPRARPASAVLARGRRGQRGVLAQDAALELAQRRAGLDTQLAGQDGAQVAISA